MMADQLRFDAVGYANPRQQNRTVLTPALDRLAREGVSAAFAWSSTPTCTPARYPQQWGHSVSRCTRAGILTGRRPWGHGMLGYGEIAKEYPLTFPQVLADAGYLTVSMGKDHFGWNASTQSGIAHGYSTTVLYDGLGKWDPTANNSWAGEYDNYDQWFSTQLPGKDPQATLDGLDGDGWNGWHGRAYVYPEDLHPTAWLGRQAVGFLNDFAAKGPLPN